MTGNRQLAYAQRIDSRWIGFLSRNIFSGITSSIIVHSCPLKSCVRFVLNIPKVGALDKV